MLQNLPQNGAQSRECPDKVYFRDYIMLRAGSDKMSISEERLGIYAGQRWLYEVCLFLKSQQQLVESQNLMKFFFL